MNKKVTLPSLCNLIGRMLFLLSMLFLVPGIGFAQNINVAFWAPDVCVDNSGGPTCENEGITLQNDIQACPDVNTVNVFTALTATDFANALTGNDILVIPEPENCNINDILASDIKAVIATFVGNGGGLLHFNGAGSTSFNETVDFFNSTFGFNFTGQSQLIGSDVATLDNAVATGTPFEGGPATLPNVNSDMTIIGFPPEGFPVYEDLTEPGYASVGFIPYMTGNVVFIGFDWFLCTDPLSELNAWGNVLCRSIQAADINNGPQPIPTMGQWAFLLFGLLVFTLGIVGVYNVKRRGVFVG